MKIIGLAGKAGAGKDSVANFLVESERFTKIAFAAPLKELCCNVFDVEPEYFDDRKLKEGELPCYITLTHSHIEKIEDALRKWGFDVDYIAQHNFIDFVGTEFKKPRQILQTIGDMLRNNIREDIFIVMLFSRIKELSSNVVVSDVRFKNERDALKKAGAKLVLVKRQELDSKDKHKSENDLGEEKEYDAVIKNDDISLQALKSEVLMWYSVAVKYK